MRLCGGDPPEWELPNKSRLDAFNRGTPFGGLERARWRLYWYRWSELLPGRSFAWTRARAKTHLHQSIGSPHTHTHMNEYSYALHTDSNPSIKKARRGTISEVQCSGFRWCGSISKVIEVEIRASNFPFPGFPVKKVFPFLRKKVNFPGITKIQTEHNLTFWTIFFLKQLEIDLAWQE